MVFSCWQPRNSGQSNGKTASNVKTNSTGFMHTGGAGVLLFGRHDLEMQVDVLRSATVGVQLQTLFAVSCPLSAGAAYDLT